MTSQDVSTMQTLLKALVEAQAAESKALTVVKAIDLKNGQDGLYCSVAGLSIPISYANSETGYFPRYMPGKQALIAALRKEAHDNLVACRSKVEGIQFQIRNLTKGTS